MYSAIDEMRKLTEKGQHFSIAFMSHDETRQKSKGLIEKTKVCLRKSTSIEQNQYAEFMLNMLDVETNIPFQCWKPCLMYFNGLKIELQ